MTINSNLTSAEKNSDLPRQIFGVCAGGVLGFVLWYISYHFFAVRLMARLDRVLDARQAQRDRRVMAVDRQESVPLV